ncbi:class I SAM-dependent methyltransferase [Thioalbus denitrificans]|uniref:Cyclopropane-fatty-acyl-phospholipid synthase n=1 Tax=Thioalbus denitrificans TaxID=547122 RepID=A0A369CF46_9GAMM|nr:class I SAM-dependent methyltransferase [Thioalbus denitrificans]RCX31306.1 cyclopropane-fatty-acyl-phospholipid synthase [Thioalbus denitrificans]
MTEVADTTWKTSYERMFGLIQKRVSGRTTTPFEIRLWGDHVYRFGDGAPAVRILAKNRRGLAALASLDELRICEAYMGGSLDVEGDMLAFAGMRGTLTDRHPLHALWQRLAPLLVGRVRSDRQVIATHYEFDNDFYLTFMDPTRCYSQAVFEGDDEPLEAAQRRKLDYAIDACGLKPGDRVLDVGGGWGAFTEHAGRRGIQVTSLTISRQSERFLSDLIDRLRLPCRVLNQNFLEHAAPEPYDGIVILGVMEHIPDYAAALRQYQRLLKPGGRVYLDASAFREKYEKATFISRYIYPGDHSFFCLPEFLGAAAGTPFEVLAVHNDRHSYYLTCKAWAENLEAARDEIIHRWGESLYRRFRLYLWGSAQAFLSRGLEAYRVVLELPAEA